MADNRAYAEKVHEELADDPVAARPAVRPVAGLPDRRGEGRPRAGRRQRRDDRPTVARSLVAATSSSRFVVPNFWRDPNTGIGYQVQVEIPQALMDSPSDVGLVPVKPTGPGRQLLLRDVADVAEGTMPGEYDRYNMQRLVSMTANIEGEDWAGWREHIADGDRKPPGHRRAACRSMCAARWSPMQ